MERFLHGPSACTISLFRWKEECILNCQPGEWNRGRSESAPSGRQAYNQGLMHQRDGEGKAELLADGV